MDPVLAAVIDMFTGGELDIQNGTKGYAYRGRISTLEFNPPSDTESGTLKVILEWNAKADGKRLGEGFAPTNGWDEDTTLEYVCNTTLPSPDIHAPDYPIATLQTTDGGLRMIIHNPYTNELTVLFPRDGSKLNHDNVRWLPDGPKAQADARKQLGQ